MGTLSIKTAHKQQQTLTPRLQHAVRLLQLSSLDFAQEVQAVLDKNPFLDVAEDDEAGLASTGPAQTMPDPAANMEGFESPPAWPARIRPCRHRPAIRTRPGDGR